MPVAAAALQEGRLAMAGLDVCHSEPLPAASPLLRLPNVVLLPHTGGSSYRSREIDLPVSPGNSRHFFAGKKTSGIFDANPPS